MNTLTIDPEFRELIPPLTPDERAELEASLLAEGCRDALVTWQGVIVDGYNRYELCQQHGIAFQTVERAFDSRNAVKVWIIRNQFGRRNLTPYIRAMLSLKLKDEIAAVAKERMLAGTNDPDQISDQGRTAEILGAAAGVSHDTIHKVEAIERDAPEAIKEKARTGEISTHRAYELSRQLEKLPEKDRDRAAALCMSHDMKAVHLARLYKSMGSVESNGTYDEIMQTGGFHWGNDLEKWCDFANATHAEIEDGLKSLSKHHAREARANKQREAPPLPDGRYNLVLADPPWEYEHVVTPSRAIENQYPTMPLDDIMALPIGELIDSAAILFLWCPNSLIRQGLEVVTAWGFDYRTNFAWVKDRIGMGYFTRSRHEMLFVAIKGGWLAPEPEGRFDSVIEAPRGRHSVKPDCVYEMIEAMYPHATRVELFARAYRDGWSSWGNEV